MFGHWHCPRRDAHSTNGAAWRPHLHESRRGRLRTRTTDGAAWRPHLLDSRQAFSRRGRLRTRAFDADGGRTRACKYIKVCIRKRPLDVCQMVSLLCCGGWDRTTDLQVMSLTSCHCSTPRYKYLRPRLFTTLPIISALSTLRSVIRFLALF